MHNLLSAFTARPWRQGMGSTLAFIFRTRAAATRARAHAASSGIAAGGACCSPPSQLARDVRGSRDSAAGHPVVVVSIASAGKRKQQQDAASPVRGADRRTSWYGAHSELDVDVDSSNHQGP
jgi:hypothetical protein